MQEPRAPEMPSATVETIDGLRVVVLREPTTGSEVHVAPELSSNVIRFRTQVGGRTIDALDPPPDAATLRERPGRYGAPALFPYPGRVGQGRFTFRGREVSLPTGTDGNAIHGFLRGRQFEVVSLDDGLVTTRIDSRRAGIPPAEWPYPCQLTLTVSLREGVLRADCDVVNTGDEPMPMGLGFHHYFPATPDHEVWIDADERWEQAPEGMPTGRIAPLAAGDGPRRPRALHDTPPEFATPRGDVRNLLFRRSAGGIGAGVRDSRLGYEVRLTGSPQFGALVLFTPPGTPSVSLEPHTCVPNALNLAARGLPTGLVVLEPGQVWHGWWEVRAAPI